MPRKTTAKATGVWEKEQGSGVWWIRYRAEGKLKREKVGRKSDAIALYQQRKSELRAGVKLPTTIWRAIVSFSGIQVVILYSGIPCSALRRHAYRNWPQA